MKGTDRFKAAIAAHMSRKFGGYVFAKENCVVAAGCGAIIDALAFCMCEDGEAFILPTPYYPYVHCRLHFHTYIHTCIASSLANSLSHSLPLCCCPTACAQ